MLIYKRLTPKNQVIKKSDSTIIMAIAERLAPEAQNALKFTEL
ncbi:MAG: hypothetical protein V7K30_01195 [Nostoc sp.]